jgi:hypothetical protein
MTKSMSCWNAAIATTFTTLTDGVSPSGASKRSGGAVKVAGILQLKRNLLSLSQSNQLAALLLLVIVVTGSSAKAQDATPTAAPAINQQPVAHVVSEGKVAAGLAVFFDKPRVTSTALNFSLRTFDTVESCRNLDRGGKEYFLPTQHCSGVAIISAGFTVGAFALERVLYKHHPRLARIPQIVSASGAASGVAFSAKHGGIR